MGWVGGLGRQLELSGPAQSTSEPEEELLAGEVTGVRRLRRFDLAGEAHRERPPQRDRERDPRSERKGAAIAPFDLADARPLEADSGTELLLGHLPPPAGRPDLIAKGPGEIPGLQGALDLGIGPFLLDHGQDATGYAGRFRSQRHFRGRSGTSLNSGSFGGQFPLSPGVPRGDQAHEDWPLFCLSPRYPPKYRWWRNLPPQGPRAAARAPRTAAKAPHGPPPRLHGCRAARGRPAASPTGLQAGGGRAWRAPARTLRARERPEPLREAEVLPVVDGDVHE